MAKKQKRRPTKKPSKSPGWAKRCADNAGDLETVRAFLVGMNCPLSNTSSLESVLRSAIRSVEASIDSLSHAAELL